MAELNLRFVPPGPVAAAFMRSDARIRMIMGPIGSGKTSTALFQMPTRAVPRPRSPVDGKRRAKFTVVRDTYRQIEKTVPPSWFNWAPKGLGHFRAEQPSTHTITINLADGSLLEVVVEFIALGDNSVEDVTRGREGTGVYLNEADLMSRDVPTFCNSRIGRYPPPRHGGCAWMGVWCDMNAPDTDNWTYRYFVEYPRAGYALFRQPGGLDAGAENPRNLPKRYYDNLVLGQPDWWARRFVHNRFGYSRDGKPVYPTFNDALHVAPRELMPVKGLPLLFGADFGLTPAIVIGQRQATGRWSILDEIVAEDMGATRVGEELLRVLATPKYRGISRGEGYGDPSGARRSDTDERGAFDVLSAVTEPPWYPAASNALGTRIDAVNAPLNRLIDAQPGLLLSPTCRVLRKGFNSGYKPRKIRLEGQVERYGDRPDKNEFSHPRDALQYLCLGGGEYLEVMQRKADRAAAARAHQAAVVDWDAFAVRLPLDVSYGKHELWLTCRLRVLTRAPFDSAASSARSDGEAVTLHRPTPQSVGFIFDNPRPEDRAEIAAIPTRGRGMRETGIRHGLPPPTRPWPGATGCRPEPAARSKPCAGCTESMLMAPRLGRA